MARPYVHPNINLHTYNDGTPPAIVIRSASLGGGLDTVAHQVDFVVGGETVASVTLYSHVNAPILVTQIDERDGADDIVTQVAHLPGPRILHADERYSMTRPHMSINQLIHLHDGTAAPTATIKTRELPGKR